MMERPILLNTDMVRAVIDGRKTQTRRPIKNQPKNGWAFEDAEKGGAFGRIKSSHPKKGKFGAFIRRGVGTDFPETDIEVCPFGMPGDRLWVRETFCMGKIDEYDSGHPAGDYQFVEQCEDKGNYPIHKQRCINERIEIDEVVWTPSIHMPRSACRLVLEVTDVRIEQVQSITEEDAKKEGTITEQMAADAGLSWRFGDRRQFQDLWDKLYPNSWANNDWVWVIDFKIVELNGKKMEQAA